MSSEEKGENIILGRQINQRSTILKLNQINEVKETSFGEYIRQNYMKCESIIVVIFNLFDCLNTTNLLKTFHFQFEIHLLCAPFLKIKPRSSILFEAKSENYKKTLKRVIWLNFKQLCVTFTSSCNVYQIDRFCFPRML